MVLAEREFGGARGQLVDFAASLAAVCQGWVSPVDIIVLCATLERDFSSAWGDRVALFVHCSDFVWSILLIIGCSGIECHRFVGLVVLEVIVLHKLIRNDGFLVELEVILCLPHELSSLPRSDIGWMLILDLWLHLNPYNRTLFLRYLVLYSVSPSNFVFDW